METICGIHAVQEAIESGRPIQHVHFQRGLHNQRLLRLMESCRQRDISLRLEPEAALERLARGAHHQGVVAVVGGHGYAELGEVLQRNPNDALLLLLDGVQDPRNLGALIRTACAAGAQAVVIPERRSAGLSPVVVQAASGAVEHLPVVRATNLAQTMETLKKQSFWIYGLDERGEKSYDEVDYRGRCALVVGGEEKGIHHLLKSKCDGLVRIPAPGKIATLNVSVAAGIVLFEAARQRKD
ncbi:MAG: 23S rRNA (guanosine(2251)-2'-O)-methyltransferase RlmB [Acidobacteria bacterium RIFCSPLOWO2_02_FULL_59_13]|nr:MAG: 23S rRNA (guanosine(2251)-2'-O)-methyltransferase RlmB [Acidobacteria bacterium RIFCSPLOWO2_02_FULL_59_13]